MTKQMGSQTSKVSTTIRADSAIPLYAQTASPSQFPTNKVTRSSDFDRAVDLDVPPPLYRPMIQMELNQLATEIEQLHQQIQAIAQAKTPSTLL